MQRQRVRASAFGASCELENADEAVTRREQVLRILYHRAHDADLFPAFQATMTGTREQRDAAAAAFIIARNSWAADMEAALAGAELVVERL